MDPEQRRAAARRELVRLERKAILFLVCVVILIALGVVAGFLLRR